MKAVVLMEHEVNLGCGVAVRLREGSSNNRVKSGYEHGRSEPVPSMVSW